MAALFRIMLVDLIPKDLLRFCETESLEANLLVVSTICFCLIRVYSIKGKTQNTHSEEELP